MYGLGDTNITNLFDDIVNQLIEQPRALRFLYIVSTDNPTNRTWQKWSRANVHAQILLLLFCDNLI